MRLEVLVNNENPVIYPINSPKLTLGASENCDIILSSEGISRKHISVLSEGDKYYVVDLGSTNGSYINEERLVPGRKTEFTSFFPVRLGHNILISLLSDEEGIGRIEIPIPSKEKSEPAKPIHTSNKTNITPLRDIKKAKTDHFIQGRSPKKSGPAKESKKVSKYKEYVVPALSVLIIAGAAFYNLKVLNSENVVEEVPAKVGAIVTKKTTPEPAKVSQYLVPDEELVKKETFLSLMNDLKCTTDLEILFCDSFPGSREGQFGAVQVGLSINVIVDGNLYFIQADRLMAADKKPPTEGKVVVDQELRYNTAAYVYLLNLKENFKGDFSKLSDYRIFVALMEKKDSGLEVGKVIALRPEVLSRLNDFIRGETLKFIKTNGAAALNITKNYYRTY